MRSRCPHHQHAEVGAEADHPLLNSGDLLLLPRFALQCLSQSELWCSQSVGKQAIEVNEFTRHILSTILAGMGGDPWPTTTPPDTVGALLVSSELRGISPKAVPPSVGIPPMELWVCGLVAVPPEPEGHPPIPATGCPPVGLKLASTGTLMPGDMVSTPDGVGQLEVPPLARLTLPPYGTVPVRELALGAEAAVPSGGGSCGGWVEAGAAVTIAGPMAGAGRESPGGCGAIVGAILVAG